MLPVAKSLGERIHFCDHATYLFDRRSSLPAEAEEYQGV